VVLVRASEPEDNRELHILEHGTTARLDIDYAVVKPDAERCQVASSPAQGRIEDVCQHILTRELFFDANETSARHGATTIV
jgi:hypothetical protein